MTLSPLKYADWKTLSVRDKDEELKELRAEREMLVKRLIYVKNRLWNAAPIVGRG
jgi:hypothetical protein